MSGGAIPHQSGTQFGEFITRVPTGQHVQHRLPGFLAQAGEGRGRAHECGEIRLGPVIHRHHGDDLLGENVQRVLWDAQFLDRPEPHAIHRNGRLQQIPAVFREEHPAADSSHLMSRATDALKAARDAGR